MSSKKQSIFDKAGTAANAPKVDPKPKQTGAATLLQLLFSEGGISLLIILPIVLFYYLKLALEMYS